MDQASHEACQQALSLLKQNLADQLIGVIAFGSRATEHNQVSSDLDLAVFLSQPLDSLARWQLAQEIAAVINLDVDLVDLTQASTVFQMQIIDNGLWLYQSDKTACAEIEVRIMAMYYQLQFERKDILDDIKLRIKQGQNKNG